MKVLAIGYSKTGTTSLGVAFSLLGYKNYDFDATFYYLRKEWTKIFNKGGTTEDFYRMYKDVDSSTDVPACMFWPEILEAFPDTKLVFCMRDEESWIKSMVHQIRCFDHSYGLQAMAWFSPTARAFYSFVTDNSRISFGSPRSRLFFKAFREASTSVLRKQYREHSSHILMNAPKNQMLIYDVKDGWEPLCKFLDKPIPDAPFPHKNQGGTIIDEYMETSPCFQVMKKEAIVFLTIYIVIAAIIVYLLL